MLRKVAVAAASNPHVEIRQDGEKFYIKTSTSVRTTEINFHIGEEFDEETVDGRKCKVNESVLKVLNLTCVCCKCSTTNQHSSTSTDTVQAYLAVAQSHNQPFKDLIIHWLQLVQVLRPASCPGEPNEGDEKQRENRDRENKKKPTKKKNRPKMFVYLFYHYCI